MGYVLLELGELDASRRMVAGLLRDMPDDSPDLRAMAMNNLAYADALIGREDLLDEADQMSGSAYGNAPWVPAFVGTRGAVLVSAGQLDEGIELLETAMARQPDRRGKAADACWIAMARARQGNSEEAASYLSMARLLDPGCPVLERAQQVIERIGTG